MGEFCKTISYQLERIKKKVGIREFLMWALFYLALPIIKGIKKAFRPQILGLTKRLK